MWWEVFFAGHAHSVTLRLDLSQRARLKYIGCAPAPVIRSKRQKGRTSANIPAPQTFKDSVQFNGRLRKSNSSVLKIWAMLDGRPVTEFPFSGACSVLRAGNHSECDRCDQREHQRQGNFGATPQARGFVCFDCNGQRSGHERGTLYNCISIPFSLSLSLSPPLTLPLPLSLAAA